jgi:G3E family GTPase
MQVNLLFGFLGSGKTTLVKRILAKRGQDSKTAVIVNEFGDVGIDGEILRGSNVDMVELNSGCMCCTLRGSLMSAVEELRTKAKVDRIVVEATGVAQPGELLETLADSSLKQDFEVGPLVTVVDVAKFNKLDAMLGDFYEAQIEDADIIVLNKIDLATAQQRDEVRREVLRINPAAEILFAEQADVDIGTLLGSRRTPEHAHAPDYDGHAHTHLDDVPVEAFALAVPFETRRGLLQAFFAELGESVWRAKGFVRMDGETVLVQYSAGQLDITPSPRRSSHEVVFIGHQMNREEIEARFATLQGS